MTPIQLIFLVVIFIGVFGAALVAARLFTNTAVRDRLDALSEQPESSFDRGRWLQQLVNLASPLAKLSVPAEGWETSAVRQPRRACFTPPRPGWPCCCRCWCSCT